MKFIDFLSYSAFWMQTINCRILIRILERTYYQISKVIFKKKLKNYKMTDNYLLSQEPSPYIDFLDHHENKFSKLRMPE